MKTSRKALAIVLSVAMILSAMVFSISAADFDETWTAVTNAAELKAVENDLAGKYYLANDIELTGAWESIGWLDSGDAAFTGTFDGNGKTISGLSMSYVSDSIGQSSNVGLFAINNGTIKNLTVADSSVMGSTQAAVIAGVNEKNGVISNCTVSDSIVSGGFWTSTSRKYWLNDGYQLGAVAGLNKGTVEKCYNDDTDVRGWYEVGGIVGHNSGTISQCASTGTINSTNSGIAGDGQITRMNYAAQAAALFNTSAGAPLAYGRAGGIVGYNAGEVSDVYVTAPRGAKLVGIAGFNSVGGVCGYNAGSIKNAYSAHVQFTMPADMSYLKYPNYSNGIYYSWANKYFHTLVGSQSASGTTENSFYSEIVSGSMPAAAYNEGGRGSSESESEMKNEKMFKEAGWNYDDIWTTDDATGLPILKFLACEHSWVETERTEPTCGTEGSVTYVCSKCGATKTEIIPATGEHVWNDGVVTKEPTCTEDGEKTYTCTVCGATKTEVIPATGKHVWNDGVVTKEPTCTEDGEKTYTCTVCGATKTEVIPATGKHEDKDKDGKCDGCGKDMQDVCDHKNTEVVPGKEPTCTEDGYTEKVVCSDCGKVISGGEVIPATGHDYKVVGKKDATCTEDGYTGDEVCSKCGDVKSTGSVIPAKGHNDKNGDGKCDDCGADIGGGSHDSGSASGSHRFFDSLLNWFTRLMILVRHLLGMTA